MLMTIVKRRRQGHTLTPNSVETVCPVATRKTADPCEVLTPRWYMLCLLASSLLSLPIAAI